VDLSLGASFPVGKISDNDREMVNSTGWRKDDQFFAAEEPQPALLESH
jgi:hypothetical protein